MKNPSHVVIPWVIAAASMLLVGCSGPPKDNSLSPPADPPPIADLVQMQAQRIAKLGRFKSNGVIELNWPDEDGTGEHFEQGDIRLFMNLPDQVSLQVHKLGDTLLWMGAVDGKYWMFDLLDDDDRVLYVGAMDSTGEVVLPGSIHPRRLLDLLGLCTLEGNRAADYDEGSGFWVVEARGNGGPVRMYLDRTTWLPRRVDSLDDSGVTLYQSELTDYESVAVDGLPPGHFPKWPMRVRITESARAGLAQLAFGEPTTKVDPKQLASACDLDRLTKSFRPHRVESIGGSPESTSPAIAESREE